MPASNSRISPGSTPHPHHPTHLSPNRPISRRKRCVWTSQWWLPLLQGRTSSPSGRSSPRSTSSATPNQSTSSHWASRPPPQLPSTSSPRPHRPRPPSPLPMMNSQRAVLAPIPASRSWRNPLRESWSTPTRSGTEKASGEWLSLGLVWGQSRKESWWAWREDHRWNRCCSWWCAARPPRSSSTMLFCCLEPRWNSLWARRRISNLPSSTNNRHNRKRRRKADRSRRRKLPRLRRNRKASKKRQRVIRRKNRSRSQMLRLREMSASKWSCSSNAMRML